MSLIITDATNGIALDEPWPHQFTKNGKGYQLADGSFAQTFICMHCYEEYVQPLIKGQRRPDWCEERCPARYTSREMKRLIR